METKKLEEPKKVLIAGSVGASLAALAFAAKGETLTIAHMNRLRGMGAQLASLPGLNGSHFGRGCSSDTNGCPKRKGLKLERLLKSCPPKTYRNAR